MNKQYRNRNRNRFRVFNRFLCSSNSSSELLVNRLLRQSAQEAKPARCDSFFLKTNAARKAFSKDAGVREECRRSINLKLESLESSRTAATYALYASLLRDCGSCKALDEGRRVHAHIFSSPSTSTDRFLLNLIVQMYCHCGDLHAARGVFDSIEDQNLYSWNIMFSGYAQNGYLEQARDLFHRMPQKNVVSWNGMITALVHRGCLREARELFDEMKNRDVVSWNAMLSGYAQNGHLQDSRTVFEGMPQRNRISWNSIVSAYAHTGHSRQALHLFRAMDLEGIVPDRVMVAAVISACSWLGALEEGKQIHAAVAEIGLEAEPIVLTGLINLYGKCGCIDRAVRLFHLMPQENMVGWTAVLTAYGHSGQLEQARSVFDSMPVKVAATWNAMLSVYAQNGHLHEALSLFRAMDVEGVQPNSITIINVLEACFNASNLTFGKYIHRSILGTGLAEDPHVKNGLLNMYAKCGSLGNALDIFYSMKDKERTVITWNAVLGAYTQSGHSREAIHLFHAMQLDGCVEPDVISFLSLLSACSHAGLLRDGLDYFVSLQFDFGIVPELGIYGCMVDLLARAGWLDLSEELINTMPAKPDVVVWVSLLGGCKLYGDLRRAVRAVRRAYQVDPHNSAPYLLLANMCTDARSKDDAALPLALETVKAIKEKNSDF